MLDGGSGTGAEDFIVSLGRTKVEYFVEKIFFNYLQLPFLQRWKRRKRTSDKITNQVTRNTD